MKKIFIFMALFFVCAIPALGTDKMVFDSTDNYLGACQLTDKSGWELKSDLNVTTFQVWYSWNQNETELPVTIYKEGEKFAEFTAVRSACDTYQKQWCNADFSINKLFPAGQYSTQIPNARQCLKPGGTGAIRLYEAETLPAKTETKPTAFNPPAVNQPTVCSCAKNIIIAVFITFLTTLSLSFFLLKKIKKTS